MEQTCDIVMVEAKMQNTTYMFVPSQFGFVDWLTFEQPLITHPCGWLLGMMRGRGTQKVRISDRVTNRANKNDKPIEA